MPRQYMTPTELNTSPVGMGFANQLAQLANGVVDQLLFNASERCDQFCNKRLQAPGSTTLASNANTGDTVISLTSTLTIDNRAEMALVIGSGVTQETVAIVPGGVSVTSMVTPYPGTVSLLAPLVHSHTTSDPVQVVYYEVSEVGGSSMSDPYVEALQTQAAQLALAHLPPEHNALTRVIFTKSYPIISILKIEHSYSFDTAYNNIDFSDGLSVVGNEGWYRVKIGTVLLREGLIRTTYTAGYQTIPNDIKLAVSYFVSEQLTLMLNPMGLQQITMGKRTQRWDTSKGSSMVALMAEDILRKYKKVC